MDCWSDVLSRITPLPISVEMTQAWPGVYAWLGLCGGYALVMLFAPVRRALVDGLHCLGRYHRIWITFTVLGFGYFVFQFVTFTPIRNWADLDLNQIISLPQWAWPRLSEIWTQTLLPAVEGVAGIFDNATTTYPLSVIAAVLMIVNWRGLHSALLRALRKRYALLGLSDLFDSVAERAGVAAEAHRLLAITGMEWPFACSRSAARVGYGRCDRIYFRISRGRLHPGLSHHCVSGLDKGFEL